MNPEQVVEYAKFIKEKFELLVKEREEYKSLLDLSIFMQFSSPGIELEFDKDIESDNDLQKIKEKYQIGPVINNIVYLTREEYDEREKLRKFYDDGDVSLVDIFNGYS